MKSHAELERSCVVANCRMNRERDVRGTNGYDRELRLDPVAHLAALGRPSRWLDVCCGTGRALGQAAALFAGAGMDVEIVGLDLIPGDDVPGVTMVAASVHDYEPPGAFDLVTCVHGLHYLGDKLGVVAKLMRALTPGGVFVANFDHLSIRDETGATPSRLIPGLLRAAGLAFDPRRRLLRGDGHRRVSFPLEYLGADDDAGPNYTGQPAVNARYRRLIS